MRNSQPSNDLLKRLTPDQIAAERRRRNQRKMDSYFPDSGPLRRELYVKHLAFFRMGADTKERAFIAGNRVGKTVFGAYETTLHLTGQYPDWWEGRRFATPIDAWVAGDTAKTCRDILQVALLGPAHERGTGMIPGEAILRVTSARGVADAVDQVFVKHVSGGISTLGFKSYGEGRANFQGTSRHLIWFDEEPTMDVYTEALVRTMTVSGTDQGGIVMLTFTPLKGWSEVVNLFMGVGNQ